MVSDELIMAFADDALEGEEKARVAAAVAADPALTERVGRLRRTRDELRGAFAGQLDLPAPASMLALFDKPVGGSGSAKILPFAKPRQPEAIPTFGWAAAAAACLAIAFVAGRVSGPAPLVRMTAERGLLADGALRQSLDKAASGGTGTVRIALSFPQQGGGFCRVFNAGADAGLACNVKGDWRIVAMATAPQAPTGDMHQAAGEIPAAIAEAAEDRRSGDPLDAAGEQEAVAKGWK